MTRARVIKSPHPPPLYLPLPDAVLQCHCEGLPRRREDRSNLVRGETRTLPRSPQGVYPEVPEGLAMTERYYDTASQERGIGITPT
jgi:hypothetical protein